ncbi:MAG: cytochrome C, partial [Gemmatimonadetes bacterium]|nr:cytochrome C [Gemmatimonadota bacterium]
FFNGQLRPGKFPLDLVIFTGRATAEYLEEEHPLEMERAERSGTLRQRMADPPPALLVTAAAVFGIGALLIGLTIAGLVVWATFR